MKKLFFLFFISITIHLPAQWMDMTPDTLYWHQRIFFNSETKGTIVGLNGIVQRTYNSGITWDTLHIDSCDWSLCGGTPWPSNLFSVCFTNDTTGFIGGQDGALFKTTDGGFTWSCGGMVGGWDDIYDIHFFNSDTGLIANAIEQVWRTVDGGQTWINFPYPQIRGWRFAGINDSTALMTSPNGIFRSLDYGATWTRMNADTDFFYNDISMSDSLHGIATVLQTGKISRTSDGGLTWTFPQTVMNNWIYSVDMLNADTGFIAGGPNPNSPNWWNHTYGMIIQTTDGGITWSQPDTISEKAIMDLNFPNDSLGFAVSWLGEILRTTNPLNTVGINESETNSIHPLLFPNPVSGNELTIITPGFSSTQKISVTVTDLAGRIIIDEQKKFIAPYTIDVSALSAGSYILVLTMDGQTCASPFVKQ